MKYDFETLPNRRIQNSRKWQVMLETGSIPQGIVPFSVADMEFKMPPEVIEGLRHFLEDNILGYGYADIGYIEACKSWIKKRHGVEINSEWMVQTTGVVQGFFAGIKALTKKGDGVVIMPPVYPPFFMSVKLQKRKLLECPLACSNGYYEIDFDKLETLFKTEKPKLLLFCSPHNPVGRVWKKAELERLVGLCLKYGVFLLVDEIHHDLVLSGHKHTMIQGLSSEVAKNCITHVSLSKTFNLAGMMLSSNFIADCDVRKKFNAVLEKEAVHLCNGLSFKAYEIAYNNCEGWLEELLLVIQRNHNLVLDLLKDTPIVANKIEGTYLQWLDCRKLGLSDEKLKEFLEKKALLFLTSGYTFGESGKGFSRLNLACPTNVLEKALIRLKNALIEL